MLHVKSSSRDLKNVYKKIIKLKQNRVIGSIFTCKLLLKKPTICCPDHIPFKSGTPQGSVLGPFKLPKLFGVRYKIFVLLLAIRLNDYVYLINNRISQSKKSFNIKTNNQAMKVLLTKNIPTTTDRFFQYLLELPLNLFLVFIIQLV